MSDALPGRLPFGMQFPPPPTDPAHAQLQAVMQAAIAGQVPRMYANAIGVGITPSDVILTVLWNGMAVCVLNLALPTARGLGEDLLSAVKDYEKTSEQSVQTSGHIAAIMQRVRSEGGSPPSDASSP